MVYELKNIAIRLWIAATAGGLATLGLLAVFGSPLDAAFNLSVAAVLTILAFLGCGWIFNRIMALRLQDCLREAMSKERTVRIGEAAEALRRAVNLFDSFMASPLFRRRTGRDLASRIARFHVARSVRSREADEFITSYLWAHPDDGEIAEYWLQGTDPSVITVFEADSNEAVFAMTAAWSDVFDIDVVPAVTGEQGLALAAQMMGG